MATGMKACILGSGSALPDPERGNPSQAIVVDDEIVLIDCGERTTVNLVTAGINPLDVDYFFFTHCTGTTSSTMAISSCRRGIAAGAKP